MFEINTENAICDVSVSILGDIRSGPTAPGKWMTAQFSSILAPPEKPWEAEVETNGWRRINARTLAWILLENSQLRQELRRQPMSALPGNGVNEMGDQTAALAHEIKQPIAAAVLDAGACLRWLRADPPDLRRAREAAARMVSDSKRAADIVDRMLSLYRKGTSKRELVNVNDLIGGIVALQRDRAAQYSVAIRTELDPALPKVSADFVQLQQVLINLMSNGIESMHGAGGELTVTSGTTEDGQILVAVRDVGVGLPAEEIDHVFEPFFTTKPDGTGLGLPISRMIVELHGGQLWAASNAGKGTTFLFTLPRLDPFAAVPNGAQ